MKMKARKNSRTKSKKMKANVRIKIQKENSLDQLLKVLDLLDQGEQDTVTIEVSDFTDEECLAFDKKLLEMVSLRSKLRGNGYHIDFQSYANPII